MNTTVIKYVNIPVATDSSTITDTILYNWIFSWRAPVVVLLLFLDWLIASIVSWLLVMIIRKLFKKKIRKNEDKNYLHKSTHLNFVCKSPWCLDRLTNSRLYAFQIILSLAVIIGGSYGILLSFEVYQILWITPLGVIFLYFSYKVSIIDKWFNSFVAKLELLWNDQLRINQFFSYKELVDTSKLKYTNWKITSIGGFRCEAVKITERGEIFHDGELGQESETYLDKKVPHVKLFWFYEFQEASKITLYPNIILRYSGKKNRV